MVKLLFTIWTIYFKEVTIMRKYFKIIFFITFILLASCSSTSKKEVDEKLVFTTPTLVTLENGTGGLYGRVDIPEFWQDYTLYAYAAPYLGDPEGEGIFILDDKLNKFNKINQDGNFQISNIPPGIYILVIGPDTETARAYRINQVAIKYTINANEYTSAGEIILN